MKSPRINIRFAGEEWVLDSAGALYWPAQQALIVSDMHLEKSTYLAHHGSFIAPYDTLDTLERLERLLEIYQPRELILLGDSFHDHNAWHRLEDSLRERILGLSDYVEHCRWVEGNHDSALLSNTLSHVSAMHRVEDVLFTHEHNPDSSQPQIIGHYHPKASLSLANRRLRSPCFVVAPHVLIMPAFGSYTGGLDIRHEAFRPVLQDAPIQLYILYQQSIYPVNREYVF